MRKEPKFSLHGLRATCATLIQHLRFYKEKQMEHFSYSKERKQRTRHAAVHISKIRPSNVTRTEIKQGTLVDFIDVIVTDV